MSELCVTATDFRAHLTDLVNCVATDGIRVVMARHGHRLVALVSQEDLYFLRKHKPAGPAAKPEDDQRIEARPPDVPRILEHPDNLELAELERLYRVTTGSRDPRVEWWRLKAFNSLRLRTGKYPEEQPFAPPVTAS
jgi:prevent-host-death family protein